MGQTDSRDHQLFRSALSLRWGSSLREGSEEGSLNLYVEFYVIEGRTRTNTYS